MVPKRPFNGDPESGPERASTSGSKRFKDIRDALDLFSVQDMAAKMEPVIRKVVREEVEGAFLRFLPPSFRASFSQNNSSGGGRRFLLRFVNKPPSTIFTGGRMEDKDGNPIRIELMDATTKTLVTSGPLSTLKIEIVVLDNGLGSDDREDWSELEFNSSVIREREGRRPLVTGGDLNVTLRGGVALMSDVSFTDNSSWQRSRRFRLGAKPVSNPCDENGQSIVREARSEAFVVKDHRGESYKKHYPPSLDDEIWRLEKIAREGASHKKLADLGIHTVKDFLRFYAINPSELRGNLGGGISKRIWDTIIDHANTCVVDDKLYAYFGAEETVWLLLDSVFKVVGIYDGQAYVPLDKLSPLQKPVVESLKQKAYRNVSDIIPADAHAIAGPSRPLTSPETDSLQQLDFSVTRQDQPEMMLDFTEPQNPNLFEAPLTQDTNESNLFLYPSTLPNSFKLSDSFPPSSGENACFTSSSHWPAVTTSDLLTTEEIYLQAQTTAQPATNSLSGCWEQGNTFIFSSGNEGEVNFIATHPRFGVHMSRIRKTKAGWCKLRAAIIKWGSVKRKIAAKRM